LGVFFALCLQNAAAQEQGYRISGVILDEQAQVLPFVSVLLKKANSNQLIKGATTDEKGSFELLDVPKGRYKLQISLIGYKRWEQDLEVLHDVTVGKISLQTDAQALNEVMVTADRPKLTRKIDRLVMDVGSSAALAGKSSLDIFSMAPGVFVNNGNISINGVSGTRVMVNGRLLNLSGDELKNYLQNLKAENVQSMEIIAHPPAEYDAEGSGGMINIILKKDANMGLNGYVEAAYVQGLGKYPSYKPSLGLNYKKGKLGMALDYAYLWNKNYQDVFQDRVAPNQGLYTSENHSITRNKNNTVRFSTTYDINEEQFIGIDYSGQYGDRTGSNSSITHIVYPRAEDNTRSAGNFPSYNKTNYTNLGLNYSWTTDTLGSKLILLSDYTYNDKHAESGSNSSTYDAVGTLIDDTAFTFYNPSVSKIFTADLKYNKKFSPKLEFTLGGKLSATNIDIANSYAILSGETGGADNSNAFDYHYKERIAAGFINLNGTVFKTDFKLGLRGENSAIEGKLMGSGQDTLIKRDYFNLFPSVFLQRNLEQQGNHALNFSYNRRITRPSYLELNPYRYYIDNYSVQTGNPLLNPQFTNAIELGYLYKKQYSVSFGYSKSKDVINQVIENDTTSALMTILRKNTGKQQVYRATLSAPFTIAKWWTTNNTLLLTRTLSVAPEFDLSLNALFFQTSQDFRFSDSFSMNLNAYYLTGLIEGNIKIDDLATIDIGFQKKLFNNKWIAKASVSDIFYTRKINASSYYNGSVLSLRQRDQNRLLTLSLTYNFNVGEVFKLKQLDKSNAEEKSRL